MFVKFVKFFVIPTERSDSLSRQKSGRNLYFFPLPTGTGQALIPSSFVRNDKTSHSSFFNRFIGSSTRSLRYIPSLLYRDGTLSDLLLISSIPQSLNPSIPQPLRYFNRINDFVDYVFRRNVFSFGFISKPDTVT